MVRRQTRKPVPARFNEFQFVKSCALLSPTGAFAHRFNPVDQILPDPIRVAVPNDVRQPMIEMNRSWQTVQAEPPPVPQLERENIRGCAYLKNHAVSARAMDGARRNQKMVVLSGREAVYVFLSVERSSVVLSRFQLPHHGLPVAMSLETEVYVAIVAGIEQIVALVLRVLHAEVLTHKLSFRMNLKREVSTTHCVEEIETNRELGSES